MILQRISFLLRSVSVRMSETNRYHPDEILSFYIKIEVNKKWLVEGLLTSKHGLEFYLLVSRYHEEYH